MIFEGTTPASFFREAARYRPASQPPTPRATISANNLPSRRWKHTLQVPASPQARRPRRSFPTEPCSSVSKPHLIVELMKVDGQSETSAASFAPLHKRARGDQALSCNVHPGKIYLPVVRSRRSVLNAAGCRHLLGEHFEPARTCITRTVRKNACRGWNGGGRRRVTSTVPSTSKRRCLMRKQSRRSRRWRWRPEVAVLAVPQSPRRR